MIYVVSAGQPVHAVVLCSAFWICEPLQTKFDKDWSSQRYENFSEYRWLRIAVNYKSGCEESKPSYHNLVAGCQRIRLKLNWEKFAFG